MVKEQTLNRFVDDHHTSDQQQTGFDKGRKIFYLGMAILMIGVGGFIRNADRIKRDGCRNQVQRGMRSFRQNAQAAGGNADENLQASYGQRSPQRIGCGPALLGLHRLGTEGRWHT